MDVLYTSLEDAKTRIWERWNDQALKRKIVEYLHGDVPEVFSNEPRAVLFRNIASPDFEFLHFLDLAKQIGLKPLIFEYLHDRFSTRNADKLCLVKMAIFEKNDSKGRPIIRYKKIIDIKKNDNKALINIETANKKKLIDFHHELVKKTVPDDPDIFDLSEWISRNGKNPRDY